jgi:hypothetical protein
MVAPVFRTATTSPSPRNVAEFENMMKKLVKESKGYKSPFVAAPDKEIIIHDPKKNPFAPLYRPDKEVLYKLDKYHKFEPPKDLRKNVVSKDCKVAPNFPSEDKPDNFNKYKNLPKYEYIKNNSGIYNAKKNYNNNMFKK